MHEDRLELTEGQLLLIRLRLAAHGDGADPKSFAKLLTKVAETEAWKEEGFSTFIAYAQAPQPKGLGMTKKQVLSAAAMAGPEIDGLVNQLISKTRLAKRGENYSPEAKGFSSVRDTNSERSQTGTYNYRRLRRDHQDLAELVDEGILSVNKAAERAGFRRLTRSVRMDDPDSAARTIKKYMSEEARRHLAELLRE